MIYGSVCSGMEAATCAWHPLGWRLAFFSEIDKTASRFLAAKFPDVPNLGDMTKFQEWPDHAIDLLVGGTPCQSFSVAGLRKGLADPRGNLMLTYLAIVDRYRPRWLVWENVPGVLSSNGGRDFGAFLGGLGQLGYGFAYRVLDAQYVRVESHARAVPQRRRRVFVVGHLGDWRRAAAVLFERESLSGHPPPRREAGKGVAAGFEESIGARRGHGAEGHRGLNPRSAGRGPNSQGSPLLGFETGPQGGSWTDVAPTMDARAKDGPIRNQLGVGVLQSNSGDVGYCLTASAQQSLDAETETLIAVAHALKGEGFDASDDGTKRGTPLVPVVAPTLRAGGNRTGGDRQPGSDVDTCETLLPIAIQGAATRENPASGPDGVGVRSDGAAYTLEARPEVQAVAYGFQPRVARNGRGDTGEVAGALNAQSGATGKGDASPHVAVNDGRWAVRRLTPTECMRLQGFPDDWFSSARLNKPLADGPMYKMIGNSMAVNCMRWIGGRIQMVDAMPSAPKKDGADS